MKKILGFLGTFQPLYVMTASLIGFAFILIWLKGPFPIPSDTSNPEKFTQAVMYPVWVFEHGITFAFITIVFLPLWKQFIELFKESVAEQDFSYKLGVGVMSISGSLIFLAFFGMFTNLASVSVASPENWPSGLNEHMKILFYYPLAAVLSIPLSSFLLYIKIAAATSKIADTNGDEEKLFQITHELLRYRSLLQNGLLILGLVVSVVPVASATLRSILLDLKLTTDVDFPTTGVIAYGLMFTVLLVLVYTPTHLMLTQASQKLRDALCPIDNLSDLDKNLKRRKDIDDWLQINQSIAQNLKAGIVTLAPLVTSFVTSILGVKL